MDLVSTGKTIAKLRKSAGLTQASLAEKLGISDKAISKWERGITCPDVSLWNKLSILLDTDIESLIYGGEDKSNWRGVLVLDSRVPASTTVYNKPLIYYLISPFLLLGITDITIVGYCPKIDLPGVAISIESEVNQRFSENTFVIYGNVFIYGPNLTKHMKRAMSRRDITVLASMKHRGEHPIVVDEDRHAKLAEEVTSNQYFVEPFVFYGGENTVKRSLNEVICENINVETMVRGMVSIDVNSYDNAFLLSEYVKMMEEITAERIGCVEEIIIRRGIAEYDDVIKRCTRDTQEYLNWIFKVNQRDVSLK